MNKVLPVIVICIMSFVLFSSVGFSVTWTGETSTSSSLAGSGTLTYFFDVDVNNGSAPPSPAPPDWDIYVEYNTGAGTCKAVCREAYTNPSSTSNDNYYCFGATDGDSYQLSSGCDVLDYSYSDFQRSSTGESTWYNCERNYQKQTASRLNLTINISGGICYFTFKHYQTSDMLMSYITKIPTPPVLGNDLTLKWDTDVNASIEGMYFRKPSGDYNNRTELESAVVDHEILVLGSQLTQSGIYSYTVFSCQGNNITSNSSWKNCAYCNGSFNTVTNTSLGQLCFEGSLGFVPVGGEEEGEEETGIPAGVSARIISVNASITVIPAGYEVLLTTLLQNNGTNNYNFYVGQSIGKNSTGIFCNRDCYLDCGNGRVLDGETYGTPSCDYLRTGTTHSGQVVILTRRYLFRADFFNATGLYDIITAVYYAPYLAPSSAYDVELMLDYFNITSVAPTITNLRTYPVGATYYAGQTDITFLWNTNLNASTILEIRKPDGTLKSVSTFDNIVGVTSHVITKGGIGFGIGTYTYTATSCLLTYPYGCSNQTKSITFAATQGEGLPNVVSPVKEWIGDLLGIPADMVLAFLGLVISVAVSVYAGYKTHDGRVVAIVLSAMILMFTIMTWIPLWILIIFVIIAAFIVTKWAKEIFTG